MQQLRIWLFLFTLLSTVLSVESQIRFVDPIFDSISMKTYTYSLIAGKSLKLDIYSPSNDNLEKRPLFILIHGGGFKYGKRNDKGLVNLARNITKKGYVVVSVDYTKLPKNKSFGCNMPKDFILETIRNATQDVTKALLFLIKYKNIFGIDDSKIILTGSSAGAEIGLNLTYNKNQILSPYYISDIPKIAAVVSISGAILDAKFITPENATPGVFYHGTKDPIIPYGDGVHHNCKKNQKGYLTESGSKAITNALKKQNSSYLLYSYVDRGHDIFNLPYEDLREAFVFLRKVVFDRGFHQEVRFR